VVLSHRLPFLFCPRILNWQQNIVRFVPGRITCGLSTKQIVAISGNLKARPRLENKGTFATNSNVLLDVALGRRPMFVCSGLRFNGLSDFCEWMFAIGRFVRGGGHLGSLR
jgi:hypothetical protein